MVIIHDYNRIKTYLTTLKIKKKKNTINTWVNLHNVNFNLL